MLSDYSKSPTSFKAFLKKQGQEELKLLGDRSVTEVKPLVDPKPLEVQEAPMSREQQVNDLQRSYLQAATKPNPAFMGQVQQGIVENPTGLRLTQPFGNRNSIESFSGGVNLGVDFAMPENTPLAVPDGEWEVVKVYGNARPGDRGANSGSGNMVKVRNVQTGEMLTFEHLNQVGVQPGQKLRGGMVFGLSGNTGNSTGPHISIPYQDAQGNYKDFLQSPYAAGLRVQG